MRRHYALFLVFYLIVSTLFAQKTTNFTGGYSAEVGAFISSTKRMPFWLRANQYGIVPLTAPVGTVRLGAHGEWKADSTVKRSRWFANYGVYAAGNVAQTNQIVLPEAYAMTGVGSFYIYAGKRREIIGLGDSTYTSGFYSWSQNATPIPKIQIGTNGFVPLKFTKSIVAFNFLYAHGWFPNTDSVQGSFLHQKSLFVRFGKPTWKAKFYAGIIHNVQWGGRSDYLKQSLTVDGKLPSSFRDYTDLIVARPPRNRPANYPGIDSNNQIGNHLGSLDFGAELMVEKWNLLLYYQHPFEDRSGLAFANSLDGLYGIRIKNTGNRSDYKFRINQLTLEYFNTTNGDKVPEGLTGRYEGDTYFNHSQYIDGWSTRQRIIGTPFITRGKDIRQEFSLPLNRSRRMIINNRIKMAHFAFAGGFNSGVQLETHLAVSQNYGPFVNPVYRNRHVNQFSGVLRTSIPTTWLGGAELQAAVSLDSGQLYDNAIGGYLGLRKRW